MMMMEFDVRLSLYEAIVPLLTRTDFFSEVVKCSRGQMKYPSNDSFLYCDRL